MWVCLLGTSEVLLVLGIVRPRGLVPLSAHAVCFGLAMVVCVVGAGVVFAVAVVAVCPWCSAKCVRAHAARSLFVLAVALVSPFGLAARRFFNFLRMFCCVVTDLGLKRAACATLVLYLLSVFADLLFSGLGFGLLLLRRVVAWRCFVPLHSDPWL